MRRIFLILYIVVSVGFVGYLLLPTPAYPEPPANAVRSTEMADIESELRRAYFTNLDREQVIAFYKNQFDDLPTLRLNYPPEDSQTLIRDQTRSTFLEELVHPFRESVYINGFEPKVAKDDIWYKGQHFRQKIIIKYEPGNLVLRLAIAVPTIIMVYLVLANWGKMLWRR